ncbi:YecA family protein [Alicyclobacillus ferrooxydans]|nr:SEC-C metal-binding domain-containing protein [Alicyclobacillus ferrooxydans]
MKVGRNDPCPCGSGKKFKKCCIDKPEYNQVAAPAAPTEHTHDFPHGAGHDHNHNHDHNHDNHHDHSHHDDHHHDHEHSSQPGVIGASPVALWDNSSSQQSASSKRSKKSSRFEILSESMEVGLQQLESGDDEGAAGKWLQGWVWLLEYADSEGLKSLEAVDAHMRGEAGDSVSNWVQDFEACLGNLSMHDEDWAIVHLRMIRDLLSTFPDTDKEIIFAMRESEAETLFVLGRREEGDAHFADLVRDFPENAWSYMGWGDMYSPAFFQDRWAKDPSRAREIYKRGLGPEVTTDREEIEERIRLLGDE